MPGEGQGPTTTPEPTRGTGAGPGHGGRLQVSLDASGRDGGAVRGRAGAPDPHRPRCGRPLDPSRDEAIRRATQELLAELGYDLVTVDAVAARAHASKATVYRRWSSKAELVIDAVSSLVPVPTHLPDTGSVAGDLRRALGSKGIVDPFRLRVMTGLVSALPRNPELARVFQEQFVRSRGALLRTVLGRAMARGEVPPDRDVDLLVTVFPAMLTYRALLTGDPVDAAYVRAVVEQILVPLATSAPAKARATAKAKVPTCQ